MPLRATESVLDAALKEDCFALQNAGCLFQTGDLSLATLHAICVRLGLGDAARLDALEVFIDCVQLVLLTSPVAGGIRGVLIESLCLLGFVLDVLIFGRFLDLVLLAGLVILGYGSLLRSSHLSEALREIRLANFQEADDAAACAIGAGMGLVCLCIVLVKHLQSQLDALQ